MNIDMKGQLIIFELVSTVIGVLGDTRSIMSMHFSTQSSSIHPFATKVQIDNEISV